MPRFHLRRPFLVAVALVVLAWLPCAARAGERYSAEDVVLVAAAMPEGWTLDASAEATAGQTALKDAILAAAKDTEGADKLAVLLRTASAPGGAKAVLALVNAEVKPAAVSAALEAVAAAKEWTVREFGDPTVLLVVSGPADTRAGAAAIQSAFATRRLAVKAEHALETPNGRARAAALGKSIAKIAPKSALVAYVDGLVGMHEAAEAATAESADAPKLWKEAAARFERALAKDAADPLTAGQRTKASGLRGQSLLQGAAGAPSPEARDALKEAVAGPEDAGLDRQQRMGFRYDLACAHARLKELDEAFKHLTAVLEEHAKSPIRGIDHWKDADADLENLKADARWEALVKKYGATAEEPKGN